MGTMIWTDILRIRRVSQESSRRNQIGEELRHDWLSQCLPGRDSICCFAAFSAWTSCEIRSRRADRPISLGKSMVVIGRN